MNKNRTILQFCRQVMARANDTLYELDSKLRVRLYPPKKPSYGAAGFLHLTADVEGLRSPFQVRISPVRHEVQSAEGPWESTFAHSVVKDVLKQYRLERQAAEAQVRNQLEAAITVLKGLKAA